MKNYHYAYHTNNKEAPAQHVQEMKVEGREISYSTLISYVGSWQLRKVLPMYTWGSGQAHGPRLKDDPCASYHSSFYQGVPCIYVEQPESAHIFLQDRQHVRRCIHTVTDLSPR